MFRPLTRSTAALLLAWACGDHVLAVEPDTFSKVVSFQYESSLDEPGTTIQSKVVSFQYFDSLGDANVTYATSPTASFFFPDGQSLFTSGTVRTPGGYLVAGATVTLKRSGTLFWQGVSDANGAFVTPGLGVANYSVTVTKDGYETFFDNALRQTTGLQSLDLRIHPLPTPPASTDVTRTATSSETTPPEPAGGATPRLLIFNGSEFVPVTATGGNSLQLNRMTVVMSHGMNSSPAEWAAALAPLIRQNHALGTVNAPNIVAWDWHGLAEGRGPGNLIPPIDNAARQGRVLGSELLALLGGNYSQKLHFIGHSLGTIVNRYACDFMHGTMPRGRNPAYPCNMTLTQPHITLLDEAEIASVAGSHVITSTKVASRLAGLQSGIAAGAVAAYLDWKSPVPSSVKWVDNYISLVGIQRSDTVNVCLLKPITDYNLGDPFGSLLFAHSYAHSFYRDTVVPVGTPPAVGFALSHEKGVTMPPGGTGLSAGSLWYEDISTAAPLDLFHKINPHPSEANAVIAVAMFAKTKAALNNQPESGVMSGYETGIRWAGDTGNAVISKTQQVAVSTKQKIGNFWDALSDGASDALNTVSADTQLAGSFIVPVFSISLRNQTAPAPAAPLSAFKNLTVTDAPADAGSPGQPSCWLSVTVPEDAGMMAFDFKVTGEPVDDEVVCAINGQNIFALPAMFTPDGVTVSTDMMDISAYAGQQIEVFFGLAGGTSTDCVLEVDGIRFVTVPMPKLALEDLGANVRLDWPVAASGWVLETSETLAPGSWQPVTGLDQAVAQDGVASLVQTKASTTRFYRLRRVP